MVTPEGKGTASSASASDTWQEAQPITVLIVPGCSTVRGAGVIGAEPVEHACLGMARRAGGRNLPILVPVGEGRRMVVAVRPHEPRLGDLRQTELLGGERAGGQDSGRSELKEENGRTS